MTQSTFMDKYPLNTLEIPKNETTLTTVDEIIAHFKARIEAHPIATFISVFDHYSHTRVLKGAINPDIKDAKNLVFCFGAAIPNSKILAVRPRSIGIAMMAEKFVIEFIDAPKEPLNELMASWSKEIVNRGA